MLIHRVTVVRASAFIRAINSLVVLPTYDGYPDPIRFVVVNGGHLIIGNIQSHGRLILLGLRGPDRRLETMLAAELIALAQTYRDRLAAAGGLDATGEVTSWGSHEFRFETPTACRANLRAALRRILGREDTIE